jgi:hypothetical protein
MTDWDSLLAWLGSGARENGTPALTDTANHLLATLQSLGVDTTLMTYVAHPLRLRLAGLVALLGAILYAWLLQRRRAWAAIAVAVALPLLLLAELDYYVPIFGWIGAAQEYHVEAAISPPAPLRHLILAAHFDSKTDLLDHVERAPIELLGVPVSLLMLIAAGTVALGRGGRPRPKLTRTAIAAALLYGVGIFLSLSAGVFVASRSHGALDNGAACAVLLRLAERLKAEPPVHTKVSLLFLSGEEIGVHGSWVYAEERFSKPPSLPTAAINLEFIGAAPDFGVFGKESFSLRRFAPDRQLLSVVDAVHQRQRSKPIYVSWYSASTDARSFLSHGIPALTIFSDPPGHPLPRKLHTAADTRARVDNAALDAALSLLEETVRNVDAW